jgi:dihydrofolate reductase
MAKLIYSAITSLDGCIEDKTGGIEWGAPDEEVHAFVNDLERPIGTYLYGRRMYETMVYWETVASGSEQSSVAWDFAEIWLGAEKIVYSRTLRTPASARTRIERAFDAAEIEKLKATSSRDVTVAGADLAGQAMVAHLVDEIHLFITPVVVGGDKRALPEDVGAHVELVDLHRFRGGVVHLHYRVHP